MTNLPPNNHLMNYILHSKNMTTPNSSSTTSENAPINYQYNNFFSHVQMLELLLAILVFIVIQSLRQKKHQGLPNWPFLGMLPSLIIGVKGNMYEWMSEVLNRQNGTFTFKGPWFTNLNCVLTSDPRNIEYLLKTKFLNFPKGQYFQSTVRDLLGNGIFNVDNEIWQKQRKTASLEIHSAKFRNMTTDCLVELVHKRLIPVLEDPVEKSSKIDLQDILLRLTFDNVCMIAFGADPGCLQPGLPDIPFAQAFEAATEATFMRFVIPTMIWKVMRFFALGSEGNLKESIKGIDCFADEVIRSRRKELSLNGNNRRSDLLTVFMGLKDDEGRPFDDKFLRDICVNFILAGRDTSSVALSWFFWLLNQNPEVEEKIMDEIRGIVSRRDGFLEGKNEIVFGPEEVKKMDYLQAALSEALRLYPSVQDN